MATGTYPTRPAPRLRRDDAEAVEVARAFHDTMSQRRSVRDFADTPVPAEVLREAVATAATAPSGANLEPWRFVVVRDPELKRRVREGAEEEEREFYHRRASEEWLDALAPLNTDEHKPFLEEAPALIVVFEVHKSETEPRPYYVKESVGIAVGLLLAGLHQAGLATLTHTPSPMKFLGPILGRPANERPYVVIPVGYPGENATVPDISRKSVEEVMVEL
ncbi:nitroreductase family protein [Haloglycomyces albus]|uniref:nitroreductase family protein n=1 Tax=Haloglycomyces albus TaxID=526067 RepID=UPI00046D7D38|nr:nitroreductase family protein [Haloglycomyces albus]